MSKMNLNLPRSFVADVLTVLAVILGIVAGIGGLYVGIWLCFIGGIVQVIDSIKLTPVDSYGVAFGVVKFMITSLVIWANWVVGIGAAAAIYTSGEKIKLVKQQAYINKNRALFNL